MEGVVPWGGTCVAQNLQMGENKSVRFAILLTTFQTMNLRSKPATHKSNWHGASENAGSQDLLRNVYLHDFSGFRNLSPQTAKNNSIGLKVLLVCHLSLCYLLNMPILPDRIWSEFGRWERNQADGKTLSSLISMLYTRMKVVQKPGLTPASMGTLPRRTGYLWFTYTVHAGTDSAVHSADPWNVYYLSRTR